LKYVYQDFYNQNKALNKLLEDDPSFKKIDTIQQIISGNKRKRKEDKIEELKIIDFA